MKKILFVCHGNVNRSAAAELIAKAKYPDKFKCRSAGIGKDAGNRITSKRMRTALAESGIENNELRSQRVTATMLEKSDIVFYMDASNLRLLTEEFPGFANKYFPFAALINEQKIKDPGFSSDPEDFKSTVKMVKGCLLAFAKAGFEPVIACPVPSKPVAAGKVTKAKKEKEEKKEKKEKPLMAGYLPITEFGKQLLDAQDLDPIYNMIHGANLSLDLRKRWVLAYSCFYHAGVASKCAEKRSTFYENLRKGHDEKWPRGSERRHFRGGTSDHVTSWLQETYPRPEDAVDYLIGDTPNPTFKQISDRVKNWKYFGPWIAFKWADLIDRVLGIPVDFSECHLDLYESPRQGAELVGKLSGKGWDVKQTVAKLEHHFRKYQAPPDFARALNVQEVETILCKFSSHTKGHYPIGKDLKEIRHALHGWGPLSERLLQFLPPEIPMAGDDKKKIF